MLNQLRTFKLSMTALIAGLALSSPATLAQDAAEYPERPVTVVVPFGAGGGTDNLMRQVVPYMSERLGEEFVIENRAGGGSAVGTVYAIAAGGDGYTLVMHSSSAAINLALYGTLPYDLFNDLKPISLLASAPVVLVTHPSTGITSFEQLLDKARAEPGQINFATGGHGSSPHLALELMMAVTGTEFVPVHYKGSGPATVDLLGGHVGMMFSGISQSREHIIAGRLNAIAVTGTKRNPALPDVPTVAELGYPDVSAAGTNWGLKAPKGTPDAIIEKVSAELAEIMQIEELRDRLGQLGYFTVGSTPEEYEKQIREEYDRWAKVVKEAGIEAE